MTRTRILPSLSDGMNLESYPVSEIDNSYPVSAYRINCCIRYRFEKLKYCPIWQVTVFNFTRKRLPGKCLSKRPLRILSKQIWFSDEPKLLVYTQLSCCLVLCHQQGYNISCLRFCFARLFWFLFIFRCKTCKLLVLYIKIAVPMCTYMFVQVVVY